MHLLVIMSPADKIHSADQLDDFISAEIPEDDPELKELISQWMIHNPCGDMNPSAPCMVSKHGRDQCRWGFPMEISKSQGQTFEFVGVLLLTAVFMHGMLYVAFSRVKRQSALKVLLPPENPTQTRNVVWKEVLNKRNSPAAPASPTRNYPDNMEDFAIDD